MAIVRKRRNPRRRRLLPRVVEVERESLDPREETTDIFQRPTESYPPGLRATYEPRKEP